MQLNQRWGALTAAGMGLICLAYSVTAQDSAFKGDIVNVHAEVRGTGFEPNHPVTVTLKDRKTGTTLMGPDGKFIAPVRADEDGPEMAATLAKLMS